MYIRWIGAALIVAGCGWFGFSLSLGYKRTEDQLKQLSHALNFMIQELSCRHTDLPQVFSDVSGQISGDVSHVLLCLGKGLLDNRADDASVCMAQALHECRQLQPPVEEFLRQMGQDIGRIDLDLQIESLQRLRDQCENLLEKMADERPMRTRNYQTLSLCVGAALAILLM